MKGPGRAQRIRELERRTRQLQADLLRAIDDAEGLFNTVWSVMFSALLDRVIALEAKIYKDEEAKKPPPDPSPEVKATAIIREVRRKLAEDAIVEARGNKTEAARILGVDAKTIFTWIRRTEERRGGSGL